MAVFWVLNELESSKRIYPVREYEPDMEYFKYTILPEPKLDENLILKIEFMPRKNTKNTILQFSSGNGLQIEPPEGMKMKEKYPDVYLLDIGDLEKDKKYEYDLKLKITKTGYWKKRISLSADEGNIFASATRFIKVSVKGGRIEDWDFKTVWKRTYHYLRHLFKTKRNSQNEEG